MEIIKGAAKEKMTRQDIMPLKKVLPSYKLLLLIKVFTGTKTEREKSPGKDTEKRLSATFFGALNVDSWAPISSEQTDGQTLAATNTQQFKDRVNISLNNKGPTAEKDKSRSSHKAERQKQTKNAPRRFCLFRHGVQFWVSSVDTGIFSTPSHQLTDLK